MKIKTTEYFTFSAKPKPIDVNPYTFRVVNPEISSGQLHDILIKGNLFLELKNIYLSASNEMMFNNITLFNPFSSIKNLSAKYLPFNGIKINCFNYTENFLTFKMEQLPKTIGYFDVIIENEAGYEKLSTGSLVAFTSSYPNAINYQKPCTKGINVIID